MDYSLIKYVMVLVFTSYSMVWYRYLIITVWYGIPVARYGMAIFPRYRTMGQPRYKELATDEGPGFIVINHTLYLRGAG